MAQVGRISGPLLKDNLLRDGIDLAFRNDLNTNQLLYLDVNNSKIGIDTSTPTTDLEISQTFQTTNLISDFSNIAGYTIDNNTLSTIGNLYLNAADAVVFSTLDNGTIRINDNAIRTVESNADIDITPNGTGTVRVGNGFLNDDSTTDTKADLQVFGNMHTPGNITFEGTITLGDQASDDVTFNSDINSDIIPDITDTYNLGADQKIWNSIYTNLLNGQLVGTQAYFLNGVNLLTKHGGIIFVAVEGNDDNSGDHHLDPMATISAALSKAEASGDQPFTIIVSPGEYQEALPLVVPSNVSVIGADIRNVIITPDTSSQSEDVFHLNDKTNIANLTIQNHYYDNVNNKGYAFRFAPNAVMSERSPYIQNVTVLTQETNPGDGDAGRGAWIDGAELNAASPNATMLFHSCTFISPNADVINMTNGVRVEWLNSFTYFANRGLYAFNGATGRTSEDGSTVIYGAELRSIGSANVYGTYGAVADGADTLMYLIQHNFAYIGAGSDRTNDLDLVVQANEVVELNSGQIHYVSTDQVGNFRVGDNFFVNFETGNTSLNINTGDIETLSGLVVNTPGGTSVIDGAYITTGNIRISDNEIVSVVDELNLDAGTNTINFNDNTNVNGNLNIINNFSFGGTLNIAGDQPGRDTAADRLVFNVEFEQDFNPHQHTVHSLGEVQRPWLNAWLNKTEVGDISIDGNVITTDTSNANLELRASGIGEIYVPSNDVQIDNNLNVNGLTTLQSTNFQGIFNSAGTFNQTGNRTATNFYVDGDLDITGAVQFEEILFDGNVITTTTSNADLELRASGTGKVLIPNDVEVNNNLLVNDITSNNINVSLQTAFNYADLTDITITQNYITTNISNADLELRASGTGFINIESPAYLENNLVVNKNTFLQNGATTYEYGPELVINGTFNTNVNGWAQAGGGTASSVNGNLRIDATGAARNVSQEIVVEPGKTYDFEAQFRSVSNANAFYLRIFESGVGTLFEWNETTGLVADQLLTASFVPQTTSIDIIFRAVDTIVEWDNISAFEDIGFVTAFTPVDVNYTDVNLTGNITQTGDITQTGNTVVAGGLTATGDFIGPVVTIDNNILQNTAEGLRLSTESSDNSSIPKIIQSIVNGATAADYTDQQDKNLVNFFINNNYVDVNQSGTLTTTDYIAWLQYVVNGQTPDPEYNAFIQPITEEILSLENATPGYFNPVLFFGDYDSPNLELRANSTANILVPNNNMRAKQDLFAASIISNNITVQQDLNLNEIVITDSIIEIDDNFISTTISNANLELRASENQIVRLPENVVIENNLTVNGITNLKNTNIVGDITLTGNTTQQGNLNVIGNVTVSSTNIESEIQFDNILFNDNFIETTDSNSDLELSANGVGNIVTNNLEVTNNLQATDLTSSNIVIGSNFEFNNALISSNIEIFDNVIRTTESNSNLELRTFDNSNIELQELLFNSDTLTTSLTDITLATDNINIISTSAIQLPFGLSTERPNIDYSIRYNSITSSFEGYNQNNISFGGIYSDNRGTRVTAHPTDNTITLVTGGNLRATVNNDNITISGLTVDDVFIDSNIVTTINSNADLELRSNGTGNLVIDDITLSGELIQNTSGNVLTIKNTSRGRTKFNTTGALKIPSGTTAEQPGFTPEVGMMRWNTDIQVLEAWDGSTFVSAAGTSASISPEEMDDLILEYTLIFG